jgi:hypothetical protein
MRTRDSDKVVLYNNLGVQIKLQVRSKQEACA